MGETWLPSPPTLSLPPGEVHLWRMALDRPDSVLGPMWELLALDERRRADRFHFEKDRRRFIAGRGSLRQILGRYVNAAPASLQFAYSAHGKPVLAGPHTGSWLHFNLSHSNTLAICACAYDQPIGVDVEWMRPLSDLEQIAQHFFSATENEQLRRLPPEQRGEAFFNCWTRKEAYLKACGVGLAHPLDRFAVSLAPGEPARMLAIDERPAEADRWFLAALKPAPDYAAAIAIEQPEAGERRDWRIKFWSL